ncbi:hypothetical protein ABZS29_23740 [Kribbella sp. NPDC005582]|uniref:hypothetical protein n=1 Tax=Kribbella sp. NPDC005582 TaxID=3156893 RepID=UPI0033B0350F
MVPLELVRRPRRRAILIALGLSDADIRRCVRRGVLQHHHGHYLDGSVVRDQAVIACAQAAYPGSVVSHFSAAHLAGLSTWVDRTRRPAPPYDATWLTRPPTAGRNQLRPDIVVRRAGLAAGDLALHEWLLTTSAARTAVDLARELPLREAVVTVDDVLRSGATRTELLTILDRQERWPGARQARTAINFGNPLSESALESIGRVFCAVAGFPPPVLQAQFFDGYQWMPERVDFWWPRFRLVAEADGLFKYDGPTPEDRRRRIRSSYRRDQRLSDRGIELVHFGWEDVVQPHSDLIARLRSAAHRGQSRPGDPPIWRVAPTALPTTATA